MKRLHTLLAGLVKLVTDPGSGTPRTASGGAHADACPADTTEAMEKVVTAIHAREISSQGTSLRELPGLAQLTQPEALVALGRLEKAGSVRIEQNLDDAFASTVTLTEPARALLGRRTRTKSSFGLNN